MLQNVYIGVSRSFPCERACSNDDHALKRVFLYLLVFSEIWFSKFFKILEVKKGISQEQRKLLGNFLSFVCSFNIFFFLFFFRRTPSSILCIYSYKKENIPEQGKKFFPLKMKIRVYISNEPAYSLNKIFGKIILRIVRLIRCLMIKLSTIRVSLDILFIVHFEEKNDSNIYISVYKTTRVHRISNRIYPFPVTNNRDNINARNFSLFRLIHEKPIRFPDPPPCVFFKHSVHRFANFAPGGFPSNEIPSRISIPPRISWLNFENASSVVRYYFEDSTFSLSSLYLPPRPPPLPSFYPLRKLTLRTDYREDGT